MSVTATLFDLCGGHPALDFVNSLDNRFREDGPNEMLASYPDLLRFLQESGLLSRQRAQALSKGITSEAAQRVLRSTRELRESAAAVLYGTVEGSRPAQADLRVLEKYFLEAERHQELQWAAASPASQPAAGQPAAAHAALKWSWGRFETEPDLPVWLLARSLSELLLSDQAAQVRECAVHTCRWLFLDTSKNHSRRWCNMKVCGNRMKARRFQARREI